MLFGHVSHGKAHCWDLDWKRGKVGLWDKDVGSGFDGVTTECTVTTDDDSPLMQFL